MLRAAIVVAVVGILAACGDVVADQPDQTPSQAEVTLEQATATTPPPSPTPAADQPLSGVLEPGTTYVFEQLGLRVTPAEEGWFAIPSQRAGEFRVSARHGTMYFLRPHSVFERQDSFLPLPDDPQSVIDTLDRHDRLRVISADEVEIGGVSGLNADIEGSFDTSGYREGADFVAFGKVFLSPGGEHVLDIGVHRLMVLDLGDEILAIMFEPQSGNSDEFLTATDRFLEWLEFE